MPSRYWFLGAALAAAVGFMAGCAAPGAAGPAPSPATSANARSNALPPAEKLVAAHSHYSAAVLHELNDQWDDALREYFEAARNDPDDELLVLEVSTRFLQQKQPGQALELLQLAAARSEASAAVLARLGSLYAQTGKRTEALVADRQAIRKSPRSLVGYQNLFLLHVRDQEPEAAMKVLDEAAQQSKVDAAFLVSLADLYGNLGIQAPALKTNAHGKALALLGRAETLKPADPPLVLQMADSFNALGQSAKAAQLYLEVLRRLPATPLLRDRLRKRLAGIYLRGSDHQRAVEQLEAILRDDPTNAEACYYLASIAFEDRRLPQAADYFGKTILLSPDFEQAYYDLAQTQIGLNHSGDALHTLGRAREKFAQTFALEFLLGLAYSREKAYREAIQHYVVAEVIARATDPTRLNEDFYFQLGAAYERKGDLEQAEKYFERCLEVAPKYSEAMNYLGYMWAEHGTNLDRARALIEQAVTLEPTNAAYLDSLGWVLFKLNQPQAALAQALKAVEHSPEPDPTLYDHLGDIFAALQEPEQARQAWRKSLSLEPNDQVKKKLAPGGLK
jgi:tetratricopeptide (TPR) repeat protein